MLTSSRHCIVGHLYGALVRVKLLNVETEGILSLHQSIAQNAFVLPIDLLQELRQRIHNQNGTLHPQSLPRIFER